MGMQAFWGTYACGVSSAEVTGQLSVSEQTEGGRPLRYLASYSVSLILDGTDSDDISTKELTLRAALMVDQKDFVLKTETGKASSAAILTAQTVSGTRVRQISTPNAQGAEFVNRRTVSFVIDAEYLVKDTENAVISWTETVSIQGNGGPRRAWRFPINAQPIRQIISPRSLVHATQSGQAVGHMRRPFRPSPLWPAFLVNESDAVQIGTPKLVGRNYVGYPLGWSYAFERGDGPLVGVPSLPPGVI